MGVWVYAVTGKEFAELIAHPKMRSIPIKLTELMSVHSRSNKCIPVAQSKRANRRNLKEV